MTRAEAIRKIVWCLLRHADEPDVAAATASTLQGYLGERYEQQIAFTNLLRAAGLFAKDEDGYFMRYRNSGTARKAEFLEIPEANYLLSFPVPVEPRMRIAYSVFSGLLLKYLYQTYGVVPIEVNEGVARLYAECELPNGDTLWAEFKSSPDVAKAVAEGLEATLGAIGNIGGIDVTETMAETALLEAFLSVLPRFERKFQNQGGMRLDFYFTSDVDAWLAQQGEGITIEPLADIWQRGWQENSQPDEIAKQIAVSVVRNINREQPIQVPTFKACWMGEGSGVNRRRGLRDAMPEPPKDKGELAQQVNKAIVLFLDKLDDKRRNTRELHEWVKFKLNSQEHRDWINLAISEIKGVLSSSNGSRPPVIDATPLLDTIEQEFRAQTLMPALRKNEEKHNREVRSAIQRTLELCLARQLAQEFQDQPSLVIFDWSVETLRRVPPEKEWALRFLKKCKPAGTRTLLKVKPLGTIELYSSTTHTKHAPFQCFRIGEEVSSATTKLPSAQRCIVCGSHLDLLAGEKSFLPEAKKRHYETPAREESAYICSNCAFIAYLSSIYPSSDLSIVEFPADNFLELFAVHEHLQGISALVALKYVNRVASLSIFPNRYLLLSHRDGQGRMDGKTQVYLQLRGQRHLLQHMDRPLRVQIEGSMPHMWSEIAPHVAVGLSHFRQLPSYYETRDSARKGFAYDVVRALQEGKPYQALYVAVQYTYGEERRVKKGRVKKRRAFERQVLAKDLATYETFINQYRELLAKSLGGRTMDQNIYQDIKEFSDYLFALLHPLVRREVQKSGSSVSGIARKYTDLIQREFAEGMAGKFLYTLCQEADQAERDGDGWVKHNTFTQLYGSSPDTKGKTGEEVANAWDEFRQTHPIQLEQKLALYYSTYGKEHAAWQKFLREVQARTLALLMLNVRQQDKSK